VTTISTIIVNYNGCNSLGELLDSMKRQTRAVDEVIVVDNASEDQSADFVEQQYPWARVLRLPANTGFAQGSNIGAAAARGDYLLLVNSDASLDPDAVAELSSMLDRDPTVVAVVPKIYRADQERTLEQAGAEFNNLGHCWTRGFNEVDSGQFDDAVEVPALTACCVMIRHEALGASALFDPTFFMYYEELDLTLRLRGRGWRIVYVPTAVCRHKGMQSVRKVTPQPALFQQFFCNRNRLKIVFKYYPWGVILRSLPLLMLSVGYWNAKFLVNSGLGLFLRAIASQVRYGTRGIAERRTAADADPRQWLPWMTWHGLAEIQALRARRGELSH
jgi:GT2 family glycosyltransferase